MTIVVFERPFGCPIHKRNLYKNRERSKEMNQIIERNNTGVSFYIFVKTI